MGPIIKSDGQILINVDPLSRADLSYPSLMLLKSKTLFSLKSRRFTFSLSLSPSSSCSSFTVSDTNLQVVVLVDSL